MPARALLISVLILAAAVAALSQQRAITGKFEGTFDVQGLGKLNVTADIRETGGKLSGVIRTPLGDAEILAGTVSADGLSMMIDAGGDDMVLAGKIGSDGSLGGTMSGMVGGNPASGTFELRRTGDLAPIEDLAPLTRQSKDKWREDLRFLAAELPKRHKNAFNHVTKERWDALVSDLDSRIPSLSDEEIILGLDRIGSSIGDGHTGIVWARLFPRLPIRLFWFGKELRVIEVSKEYPQLAGARVISINGMDVTKIFQSARQYIAQHESEEYVLDTSAFLITYPVLLKTVDAGKTLDQVRIKYVDKAGRQGSASMKPVSSGTKIEWQQPYATPPLSLRNPDKAMYFEYLKDVRTVYVNFKWYPRRGEFRKFSEELFAFVDKNDVDRLVFDFRLNSGGDFTRGRDLFVKPIKERKKFLERGRLYAITGRRTFSAGMSNAADFRNDLNAILVGEPTGARPNGYQENRSMTLPNSRIQVSYSIEFYKFSDKDTPGLIPDHYLAPDWKAYVAGRDPVLEWIIARKDFK